MAARGMDSSIRLLDKDFQEWAWRSLQRCHILTTDKTRQAGGRVVVDGKRDDPALQNGHPARRLFKAGEVPAPRWSRREGDHVLRLRVWPRRRHGTSDGRRSCVSRVGPG